MEQVQTPQPTTDEVARFSLRAYKGIEVGLGQDDPGASVAATLEAKYPDHLILIQAGRFLQGYDRTAYALHTLKQYKLKLVGTSSAPHIRVGFPMGNYNRRLWAIVQDVREPIPTLTAGGGHVGEVRAFLVKYYSEGGQDQPLTDPMHTIPTKDRIGLVTIHGEDYAIIDIGMRMLTPRELARAQGFPETYILDLHYNGKRLSKEAQVRMIGNSVCPPLARALVEVNFTHELQMARAA